MDNNNIDFSAIWQQQKVSQLNTGELLNKLKQFKKNGLRKLIVSNIILVATSGFIIFIWYQFQPQYITTKIGIVLTILAMAIFLFANNKLFSIFNNIDNTQTNSDYLKSLTALKNKTKIYANNYVEFVLYYVVIWDWFVYV